MDLYLFLQEPVVVTNALLDILALVDYRLIRVPLAFSVPWAQVLTFNHALWEHLEVELDLCELVNVRRAVQDTIVNFQEKQTWQDVVMVVRFKTWLYINWERIKMLRFVNFCVNCTSSVYYCKASFPLRLTEFSRGAEFFFVFWAIEQNESKKTKKNSSTRGKLRL